MMNNKLVYSVFFAVVCFCVFDNAEAQKDTIPAWIFEVKGFWNDEQITNEEYYYFLNYLVESHTIHDSQQYENLMRDNQIIKFYIHGNSVDPLVVNMTLAKWTELNPELAFTESENLPHLNIKSTKTQEDMRFTHTVIIGHYDPEDNSIYIATEWNPVEQLKILSWGIEHFLGISNDYDKNPNNLGYTIPYYPDPCMKMPDGIIYCS